MDLRKIDSRAKNESPNVFLIFKQIVFYLRTFINETNATPEANTLNLDIISIRPKYSFSRATECAIKLRRSKMIEILYRERKREKEKESKPA